MLKSISLENYKCFKDKTEIEIAPLTVLCGVNSSGKSSILKSLLMLKQSYENETTSNSVSFNGMYTNNGIFKDIVYGHKGSNFYISTKFEFRKSSYMTKQEKQTLKEIYDIYSKSLNINEITSSIIELKYGIKNLKRDSISKGDNILDTFLIDININNSINTTIELNHIQDKKYNITLKNFPGVDRLEPFVYISDAFCHFDNFSIVNIFYSSINVHYGNIILANLYSIFRILPLQFRDVHYISPLRSEPMRRYIIEQEVESIGIHGEFTPQFLEKTKKDNAKINNVPEDDKFTSNYTPIKLNVDEALNKWVNYIGINNYELESYEELLKLSIGNENILDVGFGISQLFPILVEGITSPFKTTLMLEQPEVHLHPKMQMNLADYLIALSKAHKNVIIETHSDHIINRLVKRIMQDETGALNENVKIYFFYKEKNETKYEQIKIDMVTGIEYAPKDFFEQFGNETLEISKIGLDNMRKGISKL